MTPTPDQLKAWREACEDWKRDQGDFGLSRKLKADHRLSVISRQALPALLDEVEALSARVERLEGALRKIASGTEDLIPPYRNMGAEQMRAIARQALTGDENVNRAAEAAQLGQPMQQSARLAPEGQFLAGKMPDAE